VSFSDSPRLEQLMRAGSIYLSLRDAIALALENNLDLEYARYGPRLAEANYQRASAGQILRNVSQGVTNGPSSASLGVESTISALGLGGAGTSGSSSSGQSGVLSGLNVQLAGSAVPNLDPELYATYNITHSTQPQSNPLAGTLALVSQSQNSTVGISQGFLTGTTVQLGIQSTIGLNENTPLAYINPLNSGALALSITQNLLQGFGMATNRRYITVAKNQETISDLTFKSQVIATVTNVVNLYWDLVSFDDQLKVKQAAYDLDRKLYLDNKRRAELGAIAEIDIIQAEAEMKTAQQDVTTQELQVEQQETILKGVLTRNGMDDMAIATAHIIPTDTIHLPAKEPIQPVQDLISEALANRPEVEQSQLGLKDARISMLGTKNALLPTLQMFANLSNSGIAGTLVPGVSSQTSYLGTAVTIPPILIGGYGSVLGQLFNHNFPNYSVGFQLTIPLRNRSAQADMITDELNYRESQIQDRQLTNNIKVNVYNNAVALSQARSAYDTSVVARQLQDQTLAGTRRKYELGMSSFMDVVIAERDDVTAQLSEVNALNQYMHARTNLDQVTGRILKDHDVSMSEALSGVVPRPPDLPVAPAPNSPAHQ
jgi:outer membrane protein